jgi:hypothetical protein
MHSAIVHAPISSRDPIDMIFVPTLTMTSMTAGSRKTSASTVSGP